MRSTTERRLPLRASFPMFMKLSGRMILQGLKGHSQSSRKHLQLQEDRGPKPSSLMVNLQLGLVPTQCSLHPLQGQLVHGMFHLVSLLHPLTNTPITPGHPPRPPIEALPKSMPMETNQATQKHPLSEPAQQGPPKIRHKAFPHGQQPPGTDSMAAASTQDMPRPGNPIPKGPPASFMPTPGNVWNMSTSLPAVQPSVRT